MPKKLDFKNMRLCLDNYPAESLYVRLVGSKGGTVKLDEKLESRTLDFRRSSSGLYLLVDSAEVFHFPLKDYDKGFSLAYERIGKDAVGNEIMIMLGTGIDPDDEKLPEPRRSFLRNCWDDHLIEIYFKGRVKLKFHSWWQEPHWKYWTIERPEDKSEDKTRNKSRDISDAIRKQENEYAEEDS